MAVTWAIGHIRYDKFIVVNMFVHLPTIHTNQQVRNFTCLHRSTIALIYTGESSFDLVLLFIISFCPFAYPSSSFVLYSLMLLSEMVCREVATLSRLQHQHVVRYYQVFYEIYLLIYSSIIGFEAVMLVKLVWLMKHVSLVVLHFFIIIFLSGLV